MNVKKRILVAVTNDVSTDQRIHKVCNYLTQKGFSIIVFGRVLPDTFEVIRPYKIIRKKLFFNANFLFYVEYNLRLLWFLLWQKGDYILSNDLDTLPACYVASKFKNTSLVYDSHEFFTEVPELHGRNFVKGFWRKLEKILVPKIKKAYTVSPKIANAYFERYGINMGVIRNVPYFNTNFTEKEVHFPTKNKIILYQGTITEKRGIKQTIQSLKYLKNVDLVIIGYGKIKQEIVEFVNREGMNSRVHFLGKIPFEILPNYTKLADVGIILEEPIGQSFQFSLPNKLFDYIHSELPILASPLDEVKKIVEKYKIGLVIENHDPKIIANHLNRLLQDKNLRNEIIENQKAIKKEYCWEKESKLLDNYFN